MNKNKGRNYAIDEVHNKVFDWFKQSGVTNAITNNDTLIAAVVLDSQVTQIAMVELLRLASTDTKKQLGANLRRMLRPETWEEILLRNESVEVPDFAIKNPSYLDNSPK